MTTSIPPAWTTGQAPNRLAALPDGALGALGGRMMSALNRRQQREVLGLVGPLDGAVVLEIGPGPGVLLRLLAGRPDVARVIGVDPSAVMRTQTIRRAAAEIAAGRVEIMAGTAAATGLPDAAVDLVVTTNTVAIWPDLDAGVAELARVLRPGGRALMTWHGGTHPTRTARRLVLPAAALDRIEDALGKRFATVERGHTRRCTVFDARH